MSEDSRRLRREKEETQADRQTVYREETRIAQELNNWRDELARTEHSLRSITGKVILNGLDSVRKVRVSFSLCAIESACLSGLKSSIFMWELVP